MTPLETELRALIIEVLNLEDVTAEDIDPEEDLFGNSGLSLDSIDALEVGVAIQKKYGIKIDSENEDLRKHFKNIRMLAAFVAEHK